MIPTIGGFDQHDDFDPDRPHRAANVDTPPEAWIPRGDLVLVKRLPDKDKLGSIFIPETSLNPERGVRRGVVVACGPGDNLLAFRCKNHAVVSFKLRDKCSGAIPVCSICKETMVLLFSNLRCSMSVSVGDEILYWRNENGDVKFQDEEFVYLHEEQHVIAVLEKAS